MSDFYIKKGAQLPSIRAMLGHPGIASATAVAWHMKLEGGTTTKTGAAVIESTQTDLIVVRYDWGGTDTDTVGLWDGEWWVTIAGLVLKLPLNTYTVVSVVADAT